MCTDLVKLNVERNKSNLSRSRLRRSLAAHGGPGYIEKFRIATSKPKSKKRKAIEAEMAAGRMKRDGQPFLGVDPDAKFFCFAGERPVLSRDELHVHVGRKVVKFQPRS